MRGSITATSPALVPASVFALVAGGAFALVLT